MEGGIFLFIFNLLFYFTNGLLNNCEENSVDIDFIAHLSHLSHLSYLSHLSPRPNLNSSSQCPTPASFKPFLDRISTKEKKRLNHLNHWSEYDLQRLPLPFKNMVLTSNKIDFTPRSTLNKLTCNRLLLLEPSHPLEWSLDTLEDIAPQLSCLPSQILRHIPALRFAFELNPWAIPDRDPNRMLPVSHLRALASLTLDRKQQLVPNRLLAVWPLRRALNDQIELDIFEDTGPLMKLAIGLRLNLFSNQNIVGSDAAVQQLIPWFTNIDKNYQSILLGLFSNPSMAWNLNQDQATFLLSHFIIKQPDDWMELLTQNAPLLPIISGLKCHHLISVNSAYAITIIKLYNQIFDSKNVFPRDLTSCFETMQIEYLDNKAALACMNQNENPLNALSISEVKLLGGRMLTNLDLSSDNLRSDVKLQILEEISELSLTDIMASTSYERVKHLASIFWKALKMLSSDKQANLKRMGSLLFFADNVEISFMAFPGFCLDDSDVKLWMEKLKKHWNNNNMSALQLNKAKNVLPLVELSALDPIFIQDNAHFQIVFDYNSEISFRDYCTNWLNQSNKSSSLYMEQTSSFIRHMSNLGNNNPLLRKVRHADDNIGLPQLVRKYWKQLFDQKLLTEREKKVAKKAFKQLHVKSMSDQRHLLGLDASVSGVKVKQIMKRKLKGGNLSLQEEEELHKMSEDMRAEMVLEIELILDVSIPRDVTKAETFFIELIDRRKRGDFSKQVDLIKSFDPLLETTTSYEDVIQLDSESILDELLKLTEEQMLEEAARKNNNSGKRPLRKLLQIEAKSIKTLMVEATVVDFVSPISTVPWIYLTTKDLESVSDLNLLNMLEQNPRLESEAMAEYIWKRLKYLLDSNGNGNITSALMLINLAPVLSKINVDFEKYFAQANSYIMDQDWGLEAIESLIHASEDILTNDVMTWISPLINCESFEKDYNFWIMAMAILEPSFCQLLTNHEDLNVLRDQCSTKHEITDGILEKECTF